MDRFSGTKQRMRCKACGKRGTIKKLRHEGTTIVRCNKCLGTSTLWKPRNRRGNLAIALVVILLLLVLTSAFIYYLRKGKETPPTSQQNDTKVPGYPLRFKSSANETITYGIYNSTGDLLREGEAHPGIIETYTSTFMNETYEIRVQSTNYYYESFKCRQEDVLRVCHLRPERIASLKLATVSESTMTLDAGDGLVKRAQVCVAWGSNTLNVDVMNTSFVPTPRRLFGLVDKCYFLDDIRGERTLVFNITRRVPLQDNVTFRFIDYEIGTTGEYTYEGLDGMPDAVFTLVR